ncbi:MAG: hypothetical protein HUU50_11225 [Candidatus Brocadiae bacterium]|nr:hypothetical protein [Candidatus Brocadiia bacterium]
MKKQSLLFMGIVLFFSLLASWWYFLGTPFILGLDYFTHLSEIHVMKEAFQEGEFLPSWNFFYGCGETFIRYQAMLSIQIMALLGLLLQKAFFLSDTETIIYTGRIFCIFLNIFTGMVCYYALKKWIPSPGAVLIATVAYLFGWQRLGEMIHVGAIPRAFAMSFYPLCFSLFLLLLRQPLTKKEQCLFGISLSCCFLGHPGVFFFLILLLFCYWCLEIFWGCCQEKRFSLLLSSLKRSRVSCMVFLGICAWYFIPAIVEKDYYGQSRILQDQQSEISLSHRLPFKHIQEFWDREAWFGNHQTDAQKGGSMLANQTGVNSAYCGILVLLLVAFSPFLFWLDRSLGCIALRLLACMGMVLVMIFWEGIRHKLFHSMGHQIFLTCRYLGILYFILCLLSALGSYAIYLFLKSKKIQYPEAIFFLFAFLIVYDFLSLIQKKNTYPEVCYRPQSHKQEAFAIAKIPYVLDSYDHLKKNGKNLGRCLELPMVNLYANAIYAQMPSPVSLENSTVWHEAISFEKMLFQELPDALFQYPLEYSNFHSCYGFQKEAFKYDPQHIAFENPMVFRTRPGWKGLTKIQTTLQVPLGKYAAMVCFPMQIPPASEVYVFQNGKKMEKAQTSLSGKTFFISFPLEPHEGKSHLEVQIQLGQSNKPFLLGSPAPPFVLYSGMALSYRLALMDIRFLAINLGYYKTSVSEFAQTPWLKKIHESSTSVLYENPLSTSYFFPRKTILLKGKGNAAFFNSQISHHPLFNPHLACFCYEGEEKDFDATLAFDRADYPKILETLFTPSSLPSNTATMIQKKTQSILWEINMKEKGFFFPSLRYHPNIKARIGEKNIPSYLAQAGMLAIPLPQGKHLLEIAYHHPWYDLLGKAISAISLGAICYVFFILSH